MGGSLFFLLQDISGLLIVLAYLPVFFPSISPFLLLSVGCLGGIMLDLAFSFRLPAFLILAGTFVLVTERMREYVFVGHFLAPLFISLFSAFWTFLFDALWSLILRHAWVNPWEPWRFLWFSLFSFLLWGYAIYGLHRGKD